MKPSSPDNSSFAYRSLLLLLVLALLGACAEGETPDLTLVAGTPAAGTPAAGTQSAGTPATPAGPGPASPSPSPMGSPSPTPNPLLLTLESDQALTTLAFNPSGEVLATGGAQGVMAWWDIAHGARVATYAGHRAAITQLAYSPTGQLLATVGEDQAVRIWDAVTGQVQLELQGGANAVAFSPDSMLVAAGSDTGAVTLWDTTTGRVARTLTGHSGGALSLDFSPDGRRLAVGTTDGRVVVWDLTSEAAEPRTLGGHTSAVRAVTFDALGEALASGDAEGNVLVWDTRTWQTTQTLEGHTGGVWSLAFGPDGERLAAASGDGAVRVWGLAEGELQHTLEGHTGAVYAVDFDPDGARLVSGGEDKTLRVWFVGRGPRPTPVATPAATPISPLATEVPPATVTPLAGAGPTSVVPPEGELAFVSTRDGNAEIYLIQADGSGLTNLTNHPAFDYEPAWAPTGEQLAFASDRSGEGGVYLMDPDGSNVQQLARTGQARVTAIAWSPMGDRLAFTTLEGTTDDVIPRTTVYVVNADGSGLTELASSRFRGVAGAVIAWAPDGSRLVFPADAGNPENQPNFYDYTVDLYTAAPDGQPREALTSGQQADYFPAWSPDGQQVVFTRGELPVQAVPDDTTAYMVPVEGGDPEPLFENTGGLVGPYRWLDGERLLFNFWPVSNAEMAPGVYVISADGTGLTDLRLPPEASLPVFSPNGELAAFDANGYVYVLRTEDLLEGTATARQVTDSGVDSQPAWRPLLE